MTKYLFAVLLLSVTMCEKNDQDIADDCGADPQDPNTVCIEIYDPVCGCNNITYPNECYAEASNVSSWTEGACASN